jgi:prepilin signal peptidase PulO-like enzyme (type II secretory pathway)
VIWTFIPILLLISYIDIKTFRIPDSLNFVVLLLGFGFTLSASTIDSNAWVSATISAAWIFAIGFIFAFLSNGAIGGGDIKLATALSFPVGAIGYDRILIAWTVIGFCSLILGLALIGLRKSLKTAIPFGPCLALGHLIAMV